MAAPRTPRMATGGHTARARTEAEMQARRRAGRYSAERAGMPDYAWREPPVNGRPVRWYVYRGTGPFASEEW